jgi:hypothetical protein
MRAKSAVTAVARVVFPGETPETDTAIRLNTLDLRRLLLHRLEVLEAALLHVADLQGKAAKAPQGQL